MVRGRYVIGRSAAPLADTLNSCGTFQFSPLREGDRNQSLSVGLAIRIVFVSSFLTKEENCRILGDSVGCTMQLPVHVRWRGVDP